MLKSINITLNLYVKSHLKKYLVGFEFSQINSGGKIKFKKII